MTLELVRTPYYDRRWRNRRRAFLRENPLCCYCQRDGKLTPATVVDHITPHRGDHDLFWNEANWQPLCRPHHDSTKQREERMGRIVGVGVDGRPMDPNHPWNR